MQRGIAWNEWPTSDEREYREIVCRRHQRRPDPRAEFAKRASSKSEHKKGAEQCYCTIGGALLIGSGHTFLAH